MSDPQFPVLLPFNDEPAGRRAARLGLRRRARRVFRFVRLAMLGLVAAFLAFEGLQVFQTLRGDAIVVAPLAVATGLAVSSLLYLAGHGLRILRLALLIGGWRVGFRDIASFHTLTAAATLFTPLKLGEVYRLFELSMLVGGAPRAIAITWWERLFDAGVILALLVVSMIGSGGRNAFDGVTVLVAAFVILSAVVFFVVPDNLRRLAVLIIRRYRDARTIPLLRLLEVTRGAILEAPRMIRGKVASLFVLSALIWVLNVAAFLVILPSLRGSWEAGPGALLGFLSLVTKGQTLIAVLSSSDPTLVAIAVTQAPLSALGFGAALFYLRRRLRAAPPTMPADARR